MVFLITAQVLVVLASILTLLFGISRTGSMTFLAFGLLVFVAMALSNQGLDWRFFPNISVLICIAIFIYLANNVHVGFQWSFALVLISLLLLSCTVYLILPNPEFPKPNGKFQVGVKSFKLADTNTDLFVFYPAQNNVNGLPKVAYLSLASTKDAPVPSFVLSHLNAKKLDVYRDAEIAQSDHKRKVLFYLHGANSISQDNSFLLAQLASQGFVTIAVSFQKPFGSYDIETALNNGPKAFSGFLGKKVVVERAKDLAILVDWLKMQSLGLDAPFFGSLELNGFGIVGHSLGGAVAVHFCANESACQAVVNLDGNGFGPAMYQGLDVPFLHFSQDAVFEVAKVSPDGELAKTAANYLDEISILMDASRSDRFWVELSGSGHLSFSDVTFWATARFGMLAMLFGNADPFLAHDTIGRITSSFFKEHLEEGDLFQSELDEHLVAQRVRLIDARSAVEK